MTRRLMLWLAILLVAVALPAALQAEGEQTTRTHTRSSHRRERAPLTADQVEAAIAVLREIQPELLPRIEALQQTHPEQVAEAIDREFPRLRHLLELQQVDPKMFELRVAHIRLAYLSQSLADRLREAAEDAPQAEQLRQELATVVSQHFDIRQQIREHELVVLERRLEQMRQQLASRAEARDQLIAQRIAELADQAEEAGEW